MHITAPAKFKHASDLRAVEAGKDPRGQSFRDSEVIVDLRPCQFVWPTAVLWCATYLLLARQRGIPCQLLVPENTGVAVYLKSAGLFEVLKNEGIRVDDRQLFAGPNPQAVVPLTRFRSTAEVDNITNQALDALTETNLGAGNLYVLISVTFAELAMNAVQHSDSPIGALGIIQIYEEGANRRFVCAVADGGIGILRSLERNPKLKGRVFYDWDAIELATRERISGTGDPTRGIGLYGVADDMRKPSSQLIIHSGIGMLQITERIESVSKRVSVLFPGTLAFASIQFGS